MTFETNYFEYNNIKYFRRNAHAVRLGSYGEKKDPITEAGYLDQAGAIKPVHLNGKVKCKSNIAIDLSGTTKTEFEGTGTVKVAGATVGAGTTYEKVKNEIEKFKLVYFEVELTAMENVLNNGAGVALNYLADEGGDGRLVVGAWILMDHVKASSYSTGTVVTASVSKDGNSLVLTGSSSTSGTQTITIDDSTFAYKLAKVQDWGKGKDSVNKLEADYGGMQ